MANCLDWEGLTAVELQRRWQQLGAWVRDVLVGQLQYPVPWCWPHHAAIVDELRAMWCWHQEIMKGDNGSAIDLLRFHDTLRRTIPQWRKPCPKNVPDGGVDANERILAVESEHTSRLLERIVREQYLARTKLVRA